MTPTAEVPRTPDQDRDGLVRRGGGGITVIAAVVAVAALSPMSVRAQEGCYFGDEGNDLYVSETLPGIGRVTYITRPHLVCAGGVQIWADSAVTYADRGLSHLIGSVRYEESGRVLRSRDARYFSNEGRLQAEGDVVVIDEAQGSMIENGDLVYLLETDFRDESEMTVTTGADGVRPRAVLTPPARSQADSVPGDSAAAPADAAAPREPYTVEGDRIFLRGSGYFTASGDVEIVRDSLFAFADSAEYTGVEGALTLVDSARVEGEAYELRGRTITMTQPGGAESVVRALRDARLTGDDVLLTAASIVVELHDGAMERLVATPLAPRGAVDADSVDSERPEADLEEYVLTADSLEVSAPGERLTRVFAAGKARSVSATRDSLNTEVLPEVARHDWLEGDTVIIRFTGADPVPPISDGAASVTTFLDTDSTSGAEGREPRADSIAEGVAPNREVGDPALVESSAAADSSGGVPDSLSQPPGAGKPLGLDPGAAAPGAPEPGNADSASSEVEEIIARIGARSLYRLPPSDSTFRAGVDAPAVHYVVGREIRIRLGSGEVQEMRVTGQTRGVHLEPLRRAVPADSAAPADTAAIRLDTLGIAVDTLGVVTDPAGAAGDTTLHANDPAREAYHSEPNRPKPAERPQGPPEDHPWIRR